MTALLNKGKIVKVVQNGISTITRLVYFCFTVKLGHTDADMIPVIILENNFT